MVLGVWMLSGLFSGDDAASDEIAQTTEEQAMAVEVTVTQSSLMSRELTLQGQLDPIRQVLIKAQTSGQVDSILVPKAHESVNSNPWSSLMRAVVVIHYWKHKRQ